MELQLRFHDDFDSEAAIDLNRGGDTIVVRQTASLRNHTRHGDKMVGIDRAFRG